MTKTLYEFITESYKCDYNVILVATENVHKALIAYCKYTGGNKRRFYGSDSFGGFR